MFHTERRSRNTLIIIIIIIIIIIASSYRRPWDTLACCWTLSNQQTPFDLGSDGILGSKNEILTSASSYLDRALDV